MLMIIGIFTQVDDAEGCLNNLAEADFQSNNISVVMKDPEEAKKILDTSGELTGLSSELLCAKKLKDFLEVQMSTATLAFALHGQYGTKVITEIFKLLVATKDASSFVSGVSNAVPPVRFVARHRADQLRRIYLTTPNIVC
jgi:hypothetical protein